MDMPDRIWAEPIWIPDDILEYEPGVGGRWFFEHFVDTKSVKYIRYTPERAAAPELLEALEWYISHAEVTHFYDMDNRSDGEDWNKRVLSAIAKARGK